MDKQSKIDNIKALLQKPNLDETQKRVLEKQLSTLEAEMAGGKRELSDSLRQFAEAMKDAGSMDEEEVRGIARTTFETLQVQFDQLSPEIKDFIEKKKVSVMTFLNIATAKSTTSQTSRQRALFYKLICDVLAGNNAYLYGPAGTGKTYIAKEVAAALNYKLIAINCNQFTSPLEIIGGQTIDGYQEGKLIQAWGNLDLGVNPANGKPYDGAVLLIDELPKLDPNTAGVMNDALSTIKDPPKFNETTGEQIPKTIYNGRNEAIPMKNLFVIGTGNTLLLRPDPNYSANFAQDASLQDRFAGSTYRVFYDYEMEYNLVMNVPAGATINGVEYPNGINFAFLFVFMMRLREAIDRLGYNNEAFVSARILKNLRDTYLVYRSNAVSPEPIQQPKTLQEGILSFMSLFTEIQQTNLKNEIPLDDFLNDDIPEANSRDLGDLSTRQQIEAAEEIIKNYNQQYGNRIL